MKDPHPHQFPEGVLLKKEDTLGTRIAIRCMHCGIVVANTHTLTEPEAEAAWTFRNLVLDAFQMHTCRRPNP